MLCAKVPSKTVANNDYHGGRDCAHNGLIDGEVEKVEEMPPGPSYISVAQGGAKVAASCDVPER